MANKIQRHVFMLEDETGSFSAADNQSGEMDNPASTSSDDEPTSVMVSFGKGLDSTPMFLKKAYKMIDTCDPSIASWSDDGYKFVVKDPDAFAKKVIPMFFDHNKLSSFARQLTFYGFQRTRPKPYRKETSNHFIFSSENFKRGRHDLLRKMRRSPRHSSKDTTTENESADELLDLHSRVVRLEQQVADKSLQIDECLSRARVNLLARMDQMILAVQLQEPTQSTLEGTMPPSLPSKSAFSLQGLPIVLAIDSSSRDEGDHPFPCNNLHPKLSSQDQSCLAVLGYQGDDVADVPTYCIVPQQDDTAVSWIASGAEHVDPKVSGLSSALTRNVWEDEARLLLALNKNCSNEFGGDQSGRVVVGYQGDDVADVPVGNTISPHDDVAFSWLANGLEHVDSKESDESTTLSQNEWDDELQLLLELDSNISNISGDDEPLKESMLTDADLFAMSAIDGTMALVEDVAFPVSTSFQAV